MGFQRVERKARRSVIRVVSALMLVAAALGGAGTSEAQVTPEVPGTWELTDPLTVARYDHTLTLLANGKVLAAGGRTQGVTPPANFNSAELYDPLTEQWNATGSLRQARWRHTATLLADGKVLVAGGFGDPAVTTNAQPVLETAEVYDPATGTWTPTGSLNVRRALHSAVLLPNGKVLVAGGRTCSSPPPATCDSSFRTRTAELYDPTTGVWTQTGRLTEDRHTTAMVLLKDGRPIIPAGFSSRGNSNTADVYDVGSGTWTMTGELNVGRARQGAMLLHDGRVLVALGFGGGQTTEIYNPATNTWTLADPLEGFPSRFNFQYGVLPNGRAIVAGGQTFPPSMLTRNTDIYDPGLNQWLRAAPMNEPHGSGSSLSNSDRMVILSASPHSFVPDPAVCGRHCGKAMVAGNSPSGSTELFSVPTVATCLDRRVTPATPPAGFNVIVGTDQGEVLTGTPGHDAIFGLGGQDQINGLGGDDVIFAGEGNDQLVGGEGFDVLCGENGHDYLDGGNGNDGLDGGAGNDRLLGGPGEDTLWGGSGYDYLDGGAGANTNDGRTESDFCQNGVNTNCFP